MAKKNAGSSSGVKSWWAGTTFAGGEGKPWTLWASWLVIGGLLVACGVVWLVPQPAGPAHDAAAAGPAPTTTRNATTKPDTVSPCPSRPTSEEITDHAPADITWQAAYGTSWPVSADVGPTKTVDGIARCFQHSPQGAAMAAVNIMQTTRTADAPDALAILAAQYVANGGRDIAQKQLPATYATQPPQSRVWGRTVGYRVESFTAGQAVVLLVESWPQRGQYTGFDVTLVWQDGDWAIQLASDGSTSLNGQITVDPTGYTPWQKPLGAGADQ
ncbi:hypothetical protein [Leifsonia aquatica]|uniref:hypothetical protein n=1 Tax=Leifsonia aquatica TaxID=144185 RepID=UPI0037F674A2